MKIYCQKLQHESDKTSRFTTSVQRTMERVKVHCGDATDKTQIVTKTIGQSSSLNKNFKLLGKQREKIQRT